MIPYDIDPTLHDHEPAPAALEDGFSPPDTQDAPPARSGDEGTTPTAGGGRAAR